MIVHKENYSPYFPTDKLCLIVFCVSTDPHIHEGRQKYRVVCVLKITKRFSIRDFSLKGVHRDTKKGSIP